MIYDQLRKATYIAIKDMRTYYLKPPLISWGIMFPAALVLAFYIRNPGNVSDVIPGLVGMTALFGATSIEAVAITFEKRVGSLDRLIMAPVSVWAVLLSKMAGGALFGAATGGALALASGAFWKLQYGWSLIPALLLSGLAFSSFGMLVAVGVHEVFEAMTLSNFFRFPMIFLCGVFVPVSSIPAPVRPISYLLPLTYSVDALRSCLGRGPVMFNLSADIAILSAFTIALFYASIHIFKRRYIP